MQPTRRDLKFQLPADRIADWHGLGPYVSHFMNTLSVFFPEGERFFIHAVRHYRGEIDDEQLKQAVTGFIGQEAMHGREHEEYNGAVAAAGYPVKEMEARVTALLEEVKANAPKSAQLAATIALEHFTAMLADKLLDDDAVLDGAEPHYARLWRWHALEETEHKAVAYDVWDQVMGRGPRAYVTRVMALVTATIVFWRLVAEFHWKMVQADPTLPRGWRARVKGYGNLAWYLFGQPGTLRRVVPEWLDYFRPGFHPWDHDNRHFLSQISALEDELEQIQKLQVAA